MSVYDILSPYRPTDVHPSGGANLNRPTHIGVEAHVSEIDKKRLKKLGFNKEGYVTKHPHGGPDFVEVYSDEELFIETSKNVSINVDIDKLVKECEEIFKNDCGYSVESINLTEGKFWQPNTKEIGEANEEE